MITMSPTSDGCQFQRLTEIDGQRPTLIEGLPGLGLVASIAADQITRQLDLTHHGNIDSEAFPPMATFEDGQVVDTVRVYAGSDPDVMTLQSAMPIPKEAYGALSGCVLGELAEAFKRAIFLVGTPAQSEEEMGQIVGLATNDAQLGEIEKAGIDVAEGNGIVGGATGALLKRCYAEDVPAIALVVKAHPRLPDPGAARVLIEEALEPLVDFDIDTTELKEQDEEIKRRMEQVAQKFQQMQQQQEGPIDEPQVSMYR